MTALCSERRVVGLLALIAATSLLAACAAPARPRTWPPAAPATIGNVDLATQVSAALAGLPAGMPAEVLREGRRMRIVLPAKLLFLTDTATMAPQASAMLAPMLAVIAAQPGMQVKLRAYTDGIGSRAYNEEFSRQRAAAMRLWLIERDVPSEAIEAHGRGESAPLDDNATAAGRERNRRVELILERAQRW